MRNIYRESDLFRKGLWGVVIILISQVVLWLFGYPRFFVDAVLWVWFKAENDVFAEVVMKVFSIVGVFWVTRRTVFRDVSFADKNINYDEVRVQLIHFIKGIFFIETLSGSGAKLEKVIHNTAYRKALHRMLKSENDDSVLRLWDHKWGHSIAGKLCEFVDEANKGSGDSPDAYYIVPTVIRTEAHTTCLTETLMTRETMEALRSLKKLHSAKVVEESHMDRLMVAHRAASIFLDCSMDVYESPEEKKFRDFTRRCFRVMRIPGKPLEFLAKLQNEKKLRGEPTEIPINWNAPEVAQVLSIFGADTLIPELIKLQDDARLASK